MGRRPRVLVPGGIYHVYNRVSRGQHVFREDEEANRFEAVLAAAKKRDEFQVLAWCVMSNHYHLAVRMGEISLSRSMGFIHHRFSQSYNGRHRVFGPFWQGRYRSKPVTDDGYLRQLIAYVHLNPVAAGVVKDAGEYRWCGHREVVGRAVGRRLVDVEETLLVFGSDWRRARAGYRSTMSAARGEEWSRSGPGGLPWWRVGRPATREDGRDLVIDETRPRIGMDGLSTAPVRPRIELEDFLEVGAGVLGVSVDDLYGRRREARIVEARRILAWLGVELYGYSVKAVAERLGKHVETASRLVSRAAGQRVDDEAFRAKLERVDGIISRSASDE